MDHYCMQWNKSCRLLWSLTRVILVTLGLSALLLPSANAHDRLGKDVSSGSSRSSRSAKSIESSSQESMTHGHPLILGDDGRTLFQAGGLPLTTEQACTDVKLASRTVQTVGGDSELLYKYCQDGFDAGSESNGSPLSEEMVMAGNGTFGTGRIVGGTRSNGSRYPYLALVFDSKSPFCQGFLVAPRWVVTAAHCVDDGTVGLKLGADNYMIDDIVGHKYVTAKVKKQIVHPTYESQYLRPGNKNLAPPADIALLQLASPVTGVKPVKMASKSDKLPKDFRVIGFGRTGEYEADMSKVIREATVKNVSRKKCEDAFNKELKKGGYWSKGAPTYSIGEGIICAGDNKTKKADACQGDSGGPLIKKGKTASEDVVFGVTSFGEGCGRKGLSGGYTNVAYYRDWIDKTIAKNGISSSPTFVTPGQRLLDEIPKTGILHVSTSSHVVDSSLVATTTGYATVKESSGATSVTTTNLTSRTYWPTRGDAVIGVVTKQGNAEYHEIDVGRGNDRVVLLPVLGFDNATKRNRPMLKEGDVVYGKIIENFDEDRVVMDCVNAGGGEGGEGYGQMREGGLLFRVTPAYARYLLSGEMDVLNVLGAKVPFEIVVGENGMFWVASQEKERERAFLETCILGSAIQKMEFLPTGQQGVDEKRILEVLKKEMGAR